MPSPSRDPLMFRLEMGASVLAILIILGVFAACHHLTPSLPVFVPSSAPAPATQESATSTAIVPVVPPDQIGTRGAICGGPARFPCAPGLECNVPPAEWPTRQGTCVPTK